MSNPPKCGYIAIVGRPNVGKSTLLNHLLEQKISITSRKRQTTRNTITGIKTVDGAQLVFVDTPGIHKGQDKAINKYMNRVASSAIKDVDVVVFVVDKMIWTDEDDSVLLQVENCGKPVIIAVNKIDEINDNALLIPHLSTLSTKLPRAEIVPLSALKGKNLDTLEKLLVSFLPENTHFYPDEQVTDRSMRFLASELVREKIVRQLGDELPHQSAVEIEDYQVEAGLVTISAVILVERDGQKRIIIGEKGSRIKKIGQLARVDLENILDCKVMLKLWVKVKSGWSDDERALRSLGYDDL